MKCFNDNLKLNFSRDCRSATAFRIYDVCFNVFHKVHEDSKGYCQDLNYTTPDDSPKHNEAIYEYIFFIRKLTYFEIIFSSFDYRLEIELSSFYQESSGKRLLLSPKKLPLAYWDFVHFFLAIPNNNNNNRESFGNFHKTQEQLLTPLIKNKLNSIRNEDTKSFYLTQNVKKNFSTFIKHSSAGKQTVHQIVCFSDPGA